MYKKFFSIIFTVFLIIAPKLSYGLESSWDGINEAKLRIISPVLQVGILNFIILLA